MKSSARLQFPIREIRTRSARILTVLASWLAWHAPTLHAQAERLAGDLDGDQIVTVRDLARLVSHIQGTTPAGELQRSIADLNQDGALNALDRAELVRKILGTSDPAQVPPCRVATSSPADGEARVAVTRETVLQFSVPLALESTIGPAAFHAGFRSRRLLGRVELSGDRRKATLFYLEPLPPRARIRVSFDGAGLNDLLGRPLDLDRDGVAGGIHQTSFETLSTSPVGGTAIRGTVLASEVSNGPGGSTNAPLAGVTITVDGAEEPMRAVTDTQGKFVLDPCPTGTFFVHIDGRTSPLSAWPNGACYPLVGKKWFADGARKDNLAGSPGDSPTGGTGIIYLPHVRAGTLQAVSLTEETEVGFPAEVLAQHPEWSGVRLKVPANSLFSDDGTRGGRIGMAPVPPARLPSPLPPGLNPALVITIQTDGGTNFDQAVPVEGQARGTRDFRSIERPPGGVREPSRPDPAAPRTAPAHLRESAPIRISRIPMRISSRTTKNSSSAIRSDRVGERWELSQISKRRIFSSGTSRRGMASASPRTERRGSRCSGSIRTIPSIPARSRENLPPALLGDIKTAGDALAVAVGGDYVAVAVGNEGRHHFGRGTSGRKQR